jgi:hypothetical protein
MTRYLAAQREEGRSELENSRAASARLAERAERPARASAGFLERISRPRLRPSLRAPRLECGVRC